MADIVDAETRSRMMSRIRGKNTGPEMSVRRFLHGRGFRYRLHDSRLPGKPDLVLPRYRTAIQVNGCFWHQHQGCRFSYSPKSKALFWRTKLMANVERDRDNAEKLRRLGWQVLTVWECEAQSEKVLTSIVNQIRRHQ